MSKSRCTGKYGQDWKRQKEHLIVDDIKTPECECFSNPTLPGSDAPASVQPGSRSDVFIYAKFRKNQWVVRRKLDTCFFQDKAIWLILEMSRQELSRIP